MDIERSFTFGMNANKFGSVGKNNPIGDNRIEPRPIGTASNWVMGTVSPESIRGEGALRLPMLPREIGVGKATREMEKHRTSR